MTVNPENYDFSTDQPETHFHVSRHSEDDDVAVFTDIYGALGYAGEELRSVADFEYEGASFTAQKVSESPGNIYFPRENFPVDPGEMESALRALAKSEQYGGLAANAENMVRQHSAKPLDRAPLYRGTDSDDLLLNSATWVATEISAKSPVTIWECPEDTYEDSEEITRCKLDG